MAAADYFLKIQGIEGESQDHKHKGEIDLMSWSWGASNSGSMAEGGGGGSGKVSMQDFHFTMRINKSTPKLLLACASGQHIKDVLFTSRKAGKEQQEFLKIKFTDVMVASYQSGGSGDGNILPVEQVALNFAKVEFEYAEQKSTGQLGGAIKAGWDLKLNKAV